MFARSPCGHGFLVNQGIRHLKFLLGQCSRSRHRYLSPRRLEQDPIGLSSGYGAVLGVDKVM